MTERDLISILGRSRTQVVQTVACHYNDCEQITSFQRVVY